GAGAGHRKMRLDLDALHAAFTRVGMTLDAANPAGRFDVAAERNQVLAERRVRRNGKGAMPKFAVEMLGMGTLDALAAAEAHVDRPPGSQQRGERPHIGNRRAAAAETDGEARVPGRVSKPCAARRLELLGDEIER